MKYDFLDRLGIQKVNSGACYGEWIKNPDGNFLASINPSTEKVIAEVKMAGSRDYEIIVEHAQKAFLKLRKMTASQRGVIVRELCDELRKHKDDLGRLISLEMGKIYEEGRGEVQEIIDLSDVALGLTRMMGGHVFPSERPNHFIFESYDPLGVIAVITAFNFPVAVWGWNALIAIVCGDPVIWKPSPQTPLSAIAMQNICSRVMAKYDLRGIFNLLIGDNTIIGSRLVSDSRIPLISFTGSTDIGLDAGSIVIKRGGKTILELGGNNAAVVLADANLDLAMRAISFGFTGTTTQRCTSTRRDYSEKSIEEQLTERIAYWCRHVAIGDPLQNETQMGPLKSERAIDAVFNAVWEAKMQGGEVIYGGKRLDRKGFFLEPTVIRTEKHLPIMDEETFGPVLYVQPIHDIEEGIALNNRVRQGLSSCLFTTNFSKAMYFLSPAGSDCGIRNINCGTSGAEIGPFGGNKHTGWGREAGGESWKQYCRHSVCNLNWSDDLPLAQGIDFFKKEK